ncbi:MULTISPECIES: thermostable hemolysin [Bradyrhizobium]|uniref:thermostable hemolysin n=1 Tax=Bradyrhizobium TaxID=374 RepID=UPI00155EAC10|nr:MULTISPECIES: thermostable hemolysin [Bradyrhizobium]
MKLTHAAGGPGGQEIILVSPGDPLWPAAAHFVRAKYHDVYGARLGALPKTLVLLVDDHAIRCAAGMRDQSERFFSEFYLDEPVERALGAVAGRLVLREEVVEVSSLVSSSPADSPRFLRSLIAYGGELGFNWAFFTATGQLQKFLRRMRLPLIELANADPSRVPMPQEWGTYYQTSPKVFAIDRSQMSAFLMQTGASQMTGAC